MPLGAARVGGVILTVKDLKDYRFLKSEIENLEADISELKSGKTMDVVKASYSDFPFTEHSLKITGNDNNAQNLIVEKRQKQAELRQKINEIESFVNSIQDKQVQRIVKLKYINDYSWQKIASIMKMKGESVPRMMCKRFFEKN